MRARCEAALGTRQALALAFAGVHEAPGLSSIPCDGTEHASHGSVTAYTNTLALTNRPPGIVRPDGCTVIAQQAIGFVTPEDKGARLQARGKI
jgi:hypothetical protein